MVELLPARKQVGTPPPRGRAAWGWGKGEGFRGLCWVPCLVSGLTAATCHLPIS